MIPADILLEFKKRMRIFHSSEDDNLEWLLSSSYEVIKSLCGDFDIEIDQEGKELVFERARYAYHDSVEFFEVNFLSRLHAYGMKLVVVKNDTV